MNFKSLYNAFRSVLIALYGVLSTFVHKLILIILNLIKMAKKKKKDLDVTIDTKKADIHITRKDGVTDIVVDTKNIDVELHKDENGIKLDVKAEGEVGKVLQVIRSVVRSIRKKRN